MHLIHLLHMLHVLTLGYHHLHSTSALWHFYLHHHAIAFLRSGITSESPGSKRAAFKLLWWLTAHRIAPVDW